MKFVTRDLQRETESVDGGDGIGSVGAPQGRSTCRLCAFTPRLDSHNYFFSISSEAMFQFRYHLSMEGGSGDCGSTAFLLCMAVTLSSVMKRSGWNKTRNGAVLQRNGYRRV